MGAEEEFDDVDSSATSTAVEETPAPANDGSEDADVFPSDVQKAIDQNPEDELDADGQAAGGETEEAKQDQEKTKTDEQVPVAINPDLMDRALRAGLSQVDIAEFGDEKSLRAAVKLIESRGAPKTQEKTEGRQEQDQTADDDDFKIELDPEAFDEKAIGVVNALVGEINNLRKRFRAIDQRDGQREHAELREFFDDQLAALGAEHEQTFGKGRRHELDDKSPAFANRQKLWEAMGTIVAGLQTRGEKQPPRQEIFKQALRLAFGDKLSEIERKKIASTLQKRKGQHINKPTSRETKDARSSDQQVVDKVADKMREMGLDPGNTQVDEF